MILFTRRQFEDEMQRRLSEQERRFYYDQQYRDLADRIYKLESRIAKLACKIEMTEGDIANNG